MCKNSNDSYLLSTSFDNTLKLWDIRENKISKNSIKTFKGCNFSEELNLIRSSINFDDSCFASGNDNG